MNPNQIIISYYEKTISIGSHVLPRGNRRIVYLV